MGYSFILNDFTLLSQAFQNIINLYGVPIQDRVGDETQTTGFIHNLLVVTSGELTLVGKENPAGQFMSIFAFVQL